MDERFYSKQGLVRMKLARKLLRGKPGDRMMTIDELTEEMNCSRGLIQTAIRDLEQSGALVLRKRGSLGTYLEEIRYKPLWEQTGWESLSGIAPLPYTKRHEGLATSIYQQMGRAEVPFHFAYMQSAQIRAEAVLHRKHHFATMSMAAAKLLIENEPQLCIALKLPAHTYLGGYAIGAIREEWTALPVLRVGIDPLSPDYFHLIHRHFDKNYERRSGQKIEFVAQPYSRMIELMQENKIDVTIYNQDTLELAFIREQFHTREILLSDEEREGTSAVFVVHREDYGMRSLLSDLIEVDAVVATQEAVAKGKMTPIY